ncbi:ABC transporter ATP-binding protein [Urechidicola croceus]|uniref:Bacitracin ABC transporter ATP-binding protein n=1 Tax=Urechidicola croceus TaxID=1850246 RepID=A0A1D8P708_9FLAO|nr:ABC transporter ATP-binding protein [Urechidicola croceus]AOW20354.1 bacitracin ABC transporter ATP-binding protein [Urechidicola croceus]
MSTQTILKQEKFAPADVMLDLHDLKKVYPTPKGDYVVLEHLDLQVKKEEFVTIIGHSGCGKTTMLSMIAGLNLISDGGISVLGSSIKGPGPDRGVIFQSPSLMPWLTTLENVMLGVKRVFPHATKKQKEDICKYYLSKVGLEGSFNKRASELSQGMQQRVGIARAFAIKPKVLLLDEPFGMLDSLTRGELQDVLIEIWNKEKITAVMITHDVDEAIFLADRVIMMTSGPRAKIGDILSIDFERPRTRKSVIGHDDYYKYRKHLIDFLEH